MMSNQLILLLEDVLLLQNQLRPINTDSSRIQFEVYNTILKLIRERIADNEYQTVNSPHVHHEHT